MKVHAFQVEYTFIHINIDLCTCPIPLLVKTFYKFTGFTDIKSNLISKDYDKSDDSIFLLSTFLTNVAIHHIFCIWIFVSKLIRYARGCSTYEQFLKRLKSSFRKLYGRKNQFKQFKWPQPFTFFSFTGVTFLIMLKGLIRLTV